MSVFRDKQSRSTNVMAVYIIVLINSFALSVAIPPFSLPVGIRFWKPKRISWAKGLRLLSPFWGAAAVPFFAQAGRRTEIWPR